MPRPESFLNLCSACERDFSSVAAFDAHRVGKHELDFPEHEDGRRCLDVEEELNWLQDSRGRWTTTKLKEQAMKLAKHHARASMKRTEATEAA